MHDPNVKLVDLYKDGVWKCKVAYTKVISTQEQNDHQDHSWQLNLARFDYDNNPGSAEVAELHFASLPNAITDSMTRIDI